MKSPRDPVQPPAGFDRRGFLAGIGSAFGAMAINLDELGRSLLVGRSAAVRGVPWPSTTAATSVTNTGSYTQYEYTFSFHGWYEGYTSIRPGSTWTKSQTLAETYEWTHTYTSPYFGSQTLTVYNTRSQQPSPAGTLWATYVAGSNGSYTRIESPSPSTGIYTIYVTVSQTCTYTTTTWWPWGEHEPGGGGMAREIEGHVDLPDPVGTLDCERDILDASTRRGAPPRLLL